jgi:sec-independent protein translocase protein TatA
MYVRRTFGPKKLPELGKGLGEGIKSFKKGIKDATESMNTPDPPSPGSTESGAPKV